MFINAQAELPKIYSFCIVKLNDNSIAEGFIDDEDKWTITQENMVIEGAEVKEWKYENGYRGE